MNRRAFLRAASYLAPFLAGVLVSFFLLPFGDADLKNGFYKKRIAELESRLKESGKRRQLYERMEKLLLKKEVGLKKEIRKLESKAERLAQRTAELERELRRLESEGD